MPKHIKNLKFILFLYPRKIISKEMNKNRWLTSAPQALKQKSSYTQVEFIKPQVSKIFRITIALESRYKKIADVEKIT